MDSAHEEKCFVASICHYFYWKAIQSQNDVDHDICHMSHDNDDNNSINDDDQTNYLTTLDNNSSNTDSSSHPTIRTDSMMTATSSITDDIENNYDSKNKRIHLKNNDRNTRYKESTKDMPKNKLTISEKYRHIYTMMQQYFPHVMKDLAAEHEMISTVPEVYRRFILYPQLYHDHVTLQSLYSSDHNIPKEKCIAGQKRKAISLENEPPQQHHVPRKDVTENHENLFTQNITSKYSLANEQNRDNIKCGRLVNGNNANRNINNSFDHKITQEDDNVKMEDKNTSDTNQNNSSNKKKSFIEFVLNQYLQEVNKSDSNDTCRNTLNQKQSQYAQELNGKAMHVYHTAIDEKPNHNNLSTQPNRDLAEIEINVDISSNNGTNVGRSQSHGTKDVTFNQQNVMIPAKQQLEQTHTSSSTHLSSITAPTSPSQPHFQEGSYAALHQIDSTQNLQRHPANPLLPDSKSYPFENQHTSLSATLNDILPSQQHCDNLSIYPYTTHFVQGNPTAGLTHSRPSNTPVTHLPFVASTRQKSMFDASCKIISEESARSEVTNNLGSVTSVDEEVKNGVWQVKHDDNKNDDLESLSSSNSSNIIDKSSSEGEEEDDSSWIRNRTRDGKTVRRRKDPSFRISRGTNQERTSKRVTRSLTNSLPESPARFSSSSPPRSRVKKNKTDSRSPNWSNHQQQLQVRKAPIMEPMIDISNNYSMYVRKDVVHQSNQGSGHFILNFDKKFPMTFDGRFALLKRHKDYYGHCQVEIPPWGSSSTDHTTYRRLYYWLSTLSCCYQQRQKRQGPSHLGHGNFNNNGPIGLSEERIQRLRSIGFEFNILPSTLVLCSPFGDDNNLKSVIHSHH
jgi:Helicase associated domain